ncbi:MAG TPA: alpha/beta hydrolase, partial [Caulobacteraceae bacterium]|nr:alpha/beta hydrolase [Caulobacteraceae bacterium]
RQDQITRRPPFVETADGTRLAYRDWGSGQPVLFLHSLGVNSELWAYQMADLLDHGYRCVAFDRRGHGRSSDPGRGYDADTLADDVAAVMETLNLRGAVLVGHSMAGGEIVRYLNRHGSSRVAKAVLVAPTTPFVLKTADNPKGVDPIMFEATEAAWRKDFPKWVSDHAAPFFVPETSPEMVRWGVHMLTQIPLLVQLACNRVVTDTDYRSDLKAIRIPTLVVHGDLDASAPLELTGRPTAEMIPGARLLVYEGAPHGLMLTHTGRLNADLREFISE